MTANGKRWMMRLAGFMLAAGAVAIWQQPWAHYALRHQVAAWIWVFVGGLFGAVGFEAIRLRMPEQAALERAEEDAVSEETFRKLRRNRWLCRAFFTIGLALWMVASFGWQGCFSSPGTCAFVMAEFLVVGYIIAEIVAMLDPRQWVYTRIARRRRRAK